MGSHLRSSQQQNDQSSTTSPPELSQDGFQQQYGNAAMQQALASGSPNAAGGPPRPDAPKSKAAALARHRQNRDRVDRVIRSGLAQEAAPAAGAQKSRVNLLRNTCQWIRAREADLFVLTPTHDAHLRPSVSADQTAYFDTRLTYDQGGADYDATLDAAGQATNDAGLKVESSDTGGSMNKDGRTMTLIDPLSRSEGELVATFVHEVQHDADRSENGQPWEVPQPATHAAAKDQAFTQVYNHYQSEFRAYWMMNPEGSSADRFGNSTDTAVTNVTITALLSGPDGTFGTADDISSTVSTAFTNLRQQKIFNHMFKRQTDNIYWNDADGWKREGYAYLPHFYALDPAFKKMVDTYTQPEGGNLINSPRIQALSAALEKGSFSTEAQALEDLDRQYLQDRSRSKPFWDQASRSLDILQLTILKNIINQPAAAGSTPHTIKVVSGDTLSAIADRYLNKADRHGEIYSKNRAKIGADPNALSVGMELVLPPL
jgi:hypothetical protein